MQYDIQDGGPKEIRVISNGERNIDKTLTEFLREDVNESLHEMIRTNVLTATRNVHHRVEAFKKEILRGKNNEMKVKNMSHRVEFQGRGAAHIHGTLWLDMKKIEESELFKAKLHEDSSPGNLSEAFRKLRDNVKLNDSEKEVIAIFTDLFVTCSLNPETAHEDKE